MILGTGIDIIEVERIRHSYTEFGEKFLKRILLPKEIEYCLSFKNPAPNIAARFSAKEAISKAFGTGIGESVGWKDMEVGKRDSGQPFVILHEKGLELLNRMGGLTIHLSLSHTLAYACAVAVIEGER